VANSEDCQTLCKNNNICKFWTYGLTSYKHPHYCWLKSSDSGREQKAGLTSGPKHCWTENSIDQC